MIESSSPASPQPCYWDYATTRHSCPERELNRVHDAGQDQSARWWGPAGFTLEFYETDFRGQGASRLRVRSPEGQDYWVEDVQLEIAEPERVVFAGRFGLESRRLRETAGRITFRRA